ncbi:nucleotidyltransferase family protein [Candidatus Woesearchaeota archaeon]|nr:nucleotidyltransferase family protein [Candidatus Woesearchaeota archaeon]
MIPEKELLILTCDLNPSEEVKREARDIISSKINIQKFFESAVKHKTLPLVLEKFGDIFPGYEKEIKIVKISHKIKMDKILKELNLISKLFDEHKIPLIVLKGFPLAQALYGDYYLRTIGDIDLLIKKKDLEKAESLLFKEGYEFYNNWGHTREWYMENHMHYEYVNKEKKTGVEIHWNLRMRDGLKDNEIPEELFWNNLQKIKIKEHEFNSIGPEFMLLQNCFHFMAHNYALPLRYLYDAHLNVEKYDLNWKFIIELAKKYNGATYLYHMLYNIKRIFKTNVPNEVIKELRSYGDKKKDLKLVDI